MSTLATSQVVANPSPASRSPAHSSRVSAEESTVKGAVSTADDLELLAQIASVKGYEAVNEQQYVCVLFDLLLYRHTDLQMKAFQMLVNYFIRNRIMIECLTQTQILESSNSVKTLSEIKASHKALKEH